MRREYLEGSRAIAVEESVQVGEFELANVSEERGRGRNRRGERPSIYALWSCFTVLTYNRIGKQITLANTSKYRTVAAATVSRKG